MSVERTIGTVFGGLLGLATVLFGHGFGQDGDIVVTSEHLVQAHTNSFRLLLRKRALTSFCKTSPALCKFVNGKFGDAGLVAFAVAFGAVCVGWALSLDYSAKLFVMTFVLVVMGSERIAGEHERHAAYHAHVCSSKHSWAYQ